MTIAIPLYCVPLIFLVYYQVSMNVILISGLWNSTLELRRASAEQQDQRGKGGNCGNHRLACHPQRKQTSETITPNSVPPPKKYIHHC